ncbi:MAG: hypothetical protein AB1757_04495 [Acidobacteriota bacterium]
MMHMRGLLCLFTFLIWLSIEPITLAQNKAFVIDDRLSALRRAPDLKSTVLRRLRIGRAVYIVETRPARNQQPKFYRVAVTRRTRGWLHEGAIVLPGRAGEDARALSLIQLAEGFDRLALCQFFIEKFNRSPLLPRVLLTFAEEAERAAAQLNRSADRRLKNLSTTDSKFAARDYYLSDTGLDRYSRLQIHFEFVEKHSEYIYDGQAYKEILRRFPKSEEAKVAAKQLESQRQRLAQK